MKHLLEKAVSKNLRAFLQTFFKLWFSLQIRGEFPLPPVALLGGTGQETSAVPNVPPRRASLQRPVTSHGLPARRTPRSRALLWERSCS